MIRLLLIPVMLAAACLCAGFYGALHNQVSYTVSPEYFHGFKFTQFNIPTELQNRWGAALVGWRASWWMGPIIGTPIVVATLFISPIRRAFRVFLSTTLLVICITLGIGLLALFAGFTVINTDFLTDLINRPGLRDPIAFARAGWMHEFAYIGGLIGLIAGIIHVIRQARRT
ncbi:MAG: hypothetical protein AAF826_00060 [Pseudomonadota bacterium]